MRRWPNTRQTPPMTSFPLTVVQTYHWISIISLPICLKSHNLLTDPSQAAETKSGFLWEICELQPKCISNALQAILSLQKKKNWCFFFFSPDSSGAFLHDELISFPLEPTRRNKPKVSPLAWIVDMKQDGFHLFLVKPTQAVTLVSMLHVTIKLTSIYLVEGRNFDTLKVTKY